MDNSRFINYIATFFTNALTSKQFHLMESKEQTLSQFYRNLDIYSTGVNTPLRERCLEYETIKAMLMEYIAKYDRSYPDQMIMAMSRQICSETMFRQFRPKDHNQLFRKVIVDCIKNFVIYIISVARDYTNIVFKNQPEELKKFRISIVGRFESIIYGIINKIRVDFECATTGANPELLNSISQDQQVMDSLRSVNEELQNRILQLEEENIRLKQQIIALSRDQDQIESNNEEDVI